MLERVAPTIAIAGLGAVVGVDLVEAVEALAPEPDRLVVTHPLGLVGTPGGGEVAVPAAPAPRTTLTATASSGWSLAARVQPVAESWSGGMGTRTITAVGPLERLEKTFPHRLGTDADVAVFNAGGQGNRSDSPTGPGGTYVFGGSNLWTAADILRALVATAVADGDLPATTVTIPSGMLTHTPTVDVRGASLLSAIANIIGSRGACWRITGTATLTLTVHDPTAAGTSVVLTGPFIRTASHTKDPSATVARLQLRSGPWTEVRMLEVGAGGSGDLTYLGLTADGGGLRFRVNALTLGDGTSSDAGGIALSLPVSSTGVPGSRYASPARVFVKRAGGEPFQGRWEAIPCSITVEADDVIALSGGDVVDAYLGNAQPVDGSRPVPACDRLAVTLGLVSGAPVKATLSGGAGNGASRIDVGGDYVTVASNAGWTVNVGGVLQTIGPASAGNGPSALAAAAGRAWADLSQDADVLTWSDVGVVGDTYPPGTVISSVTMPDGSVRSVRCVVVRRTVRVTNGVPTTTWEARQPPWGEVLTA